MAKDKHVTMKFKADTKEAESGISKVTSSLNKLAKDVEKNPITKLSKSVTMLGGAFHVATGIINKVSGAISDVTEASRVQITAEKQLEAAAKNNPYLSEYSVQQLKAYAGELQSISTVGDEELLPMMAQLAVAGRTQSEIQDIMTTALNMSATEAISLDTAVKQLNTTYSGSAGRLSQMSGAVKALSADELKNGDAVKILKEQYSGIAKSVAESTGGWQQFKNTFGDLKEVIGSAFMSLQNSAGKVLNNFFGTVIEKLQSAGKEAEEFKKKLNITATLKDEKASVADLEGVVNQLTEDLEEMQRVQKAANSDQSKWTKDLKKEWEESKSAYKTHLEELRNVESQLRINKEALESQRQAELLNSSGIEETTRIYSKYADSIADATAEYKEAKFTADEYANSEIKNVSEIEKKYKNANAEFLKLNSAFQNGWNGSSNRLQRDIDSVTKQLSEAQEKLTEAQKNAGEGTVSEADKKALDIITKNNAELQKNIEAIKQKYELMKSEGKKIDELAEKQEILSVKESAYLKLISEDASVVTQNNSVARARLNDIKQGYEEITEAIKKKAAAEKDKDAIKALKVETEKLTEEAKKFLGVFDETKLSESISASIQKLEEMKGSVKQGSAEWEYYSTQILRLSGFLDEVLEKEKEIAAVNNETEVQEWAKLHEQKFQIASEFAGKYAEIMSGISDLVAKNAENESAVKIAELDKQLEAGKISEEEYAEMKEKIENESAEKKYKAQMWEWSANILNIQAQTALAVVKALAEGGPYAGPAMAAMIGILGGVQLATAIQSKPIPPSFATGGVVGGFVGASSGEDNTYIHARNGEMVLNAAQQKALWESIGNGAVKGDVSMNVKVINNTSNEVRSNARLSPEGLIVTIDKIVNSSMQQGKYTDSMNIAQSQSQGVRYL
ncbi:hypothetical protein DYE50_01380 [Treponema ruminis]|uniref:Chromosome segregation ATPase n=1 Tax=Treponema ruminis TaxID=744515 RepID=A0A7W8GBU4_9SPIR|nr:hypothetical protein [Treponema ruminis]MBB5227427.1 chromosome segregation ATPase [Treponema ruminis]QSI01235.1 hypothetical protein DYE50_01380 [Treponema ruminis]